MASIPRNLADSEKLQNRGAGHPREARSAPLQSLSIDPAARRAVQNLSTASAPRAARPRAARTGRARRAVW